MAIPDVDRDILELAVEDLYGLWELVWRAKRRYPETSDSDVRAIVQDSVRRLLGEGLISLYRRAAEDNFAAVSPRSAESILTDPRNWDEPRSDPLEFRVGATEQGKRQYHGRG